MFVDLAATESNNSHQIQSQFIGAEKQNRQIAIEIKEFRGKSVVADLEQAIGQYTLYKLLLNQVDPERVIYLAVTDIIYEEIFSEPIGKLVISDLPMKLLVIDSNKAEVKQWIPPRIMREL